MRIYLVQPAIAHRRPDRNREAIIRLLGRPVEEQGLIVLPEMYSTGFLIRESRLEGAGGEDDAGLLETDLAFLAELARTKRCFVLGSSVGREEGRLLNLSLLLDPQGNLALTYRKVHPFTFGGEDRHFKPGSELGPARVGAFTLVPTICYDLRFPELYRLGLSLGAQIFTVQANWPQARQSHWDLLLGARAVENQAFVAGVNCTGRQAHLTFSGGSQVVSPKGEVLARAGDGETVLETEIRLRDVIDWRNRFPAVRDCRPFEFYRGLAQVTGGSGGRDALSSPY